MEGSEVFLASLLLQLPVANHLVEQDGLNTVVLALRIANMGYQVRRTVKVTQQKIIGQAKNSPIGHPPAKGGDEGGLP